MSLISGKYWTGDPTIKPEAWGPLEDVQAAIITNSEKLGIPAPKGVFPIWEGSGNPYDVMSGEKGSLYGSVQPIWQIGQNGLELFHSTTNTGYLFSKCVDGMQYGSNEEWSIFAIARAGTSTQTEVVASIGSTVNSYWHGLSCRYQTTDPDPYVSFEVDAYKTATAYTDAKKEKDNLIIAGANYGSSYRKAFVSNKHEISIGEDTGSASNRAIMNRFGLGIFADSTPAGSTPIITLVFFWPDYAITDNCFGGLSDNPYGMLQPITRRSYFIPDGDSGNTYQVTCADGFSFSDSSLRNAIFSAACDEAINLSDNDSNIAQFLAALSDSFGLSDISNTTAIYNVSVHDSLNINDTVTSLQKIIALVDDTISIADVSIVRADIQGIATDSMVLSDSLTAALQAHAVVNEIINLSDTISTTTLGVIAALVSETFTVSDSTTSTAALIATISDALSLSDNAISVLTARANIAESFTLNDSSTWASITSALVVDGFTLSDDIDCRADLISELIENINISDAAQSVLSAYAHVSDSLSVSDTTFWAGIKQAIAEDSFAVSGSVIGLIKLIANAADSIAIDDSNNVTATFSVMCDDTVQFAHAIAAIAQFRASVSDGFNINATAMEVSTLPNGKVSVSFSFKKTTVVFNFK